jgi:hypothetical protein
METLRQQTSPGTQGKLMFSQVVSLASHTAAQESDLERKMTATSGRKCLEQFARFNRAGLWAKTFAALLIGMEGWYSTKCRLTWKMRATKSHRIYFQLAPSTHPTEGIESGLLLSTPSKSPMADITEERATEKGWVWKGTAWYRPDGSKVQTTLGHQIVMLPTPTKVQRDHPERVEALKATGAKTIQSRNCGENRPNSILDAVNFYGTLPTPRKQSANSPAEHGQGGKDLQTYVRDNLIPTCTKRDYKGARSLEALKASGRTATNSLPDAFAQTGISSQLNPQFVAEMMGFPTDWLELPFLSTEKRQ